MKESLHLLSLGVALASVGVVAYEKFYEPSRSQAEIEALQRRVDRAENMLRANTYIDCIRERLYIHPNINLEDCYDIRVRVANGLEVKK